MEKVVEYGTKFYISVAHRSCSSQMQICQLLHDYQKSCLGMDAVGLQSHKVKQEFAKKVNKT